MITYEVLNVITCEAYLHVLYQVNGLTWEYVGKSVLWSVVWEFGYCVGVHRVRAKRLQ